MYSANFLHDWVQNLRIYFKDNTDYRDHWMVNALWWVVIDYIDLTIFVNVLQESLSLSVSKHEQELQDIMETIPSGACNDSVSHETMAC